MTDVYFNIVSIIYKRNYFTKMMNYNKKIFLCAMLILQFSIEIPPKTMEEICILNMKNPACSKVLDTKNVHCLSAEFNVFNLPMLLMFEQKYME